MSTQPSTAIDFERERAEARAQRETALRESAALQTTREIEYEPLWQRIADRRRQNGFGEDYEIIAPRRFSHEGRTA